jgi:hypothetical protein
VHRVDLAGSLIPTFGANDLLTCLALHGARHCWVSLGWICDVANLIAVAPLDWEEILSNRSTRRMVHVSVLLASDLLSAPVPPDVIERARRDSSAVGVTRLICQNLFQADADLAGRPSGALMQLRMLGGVRDRIRYVLRRGLEANQTDNDALSLPASLRPLLYLARPFRVLAKTVGRS